MDKILDSKGPRQRILEVAIRSFHQQGYIATEISSQDSQLHQEVFLEKKCARERMEKKFENFKNCIK